MLKFKTMVVSFREKKKINEEKQSNYDMAVANQ